MFFIQPWASPRLFSRHTRPHLCVCSRARARRATWWRPREIILYVAAHKHTKSRFSRAPFSSTSPAHGFFSLFIDPLFRRALPILFRSTSENNDDGDSKNTVTREPIDPGGTAASVVSRRRISSSKSDRSGTSRARDMTHFHFLPFLYAGAININCFWSVTNTCRGHVQHLRRPYRRFTTAYAHFTHHRRYASSAVCDDYLILFYRSRCLVEHSRFR